MNCSIKNIILLILLFSFNNSLIFSQFDSKIYFDHLTIKEGLSHNTVHCMAQDSDGYIWIGTQNGLNKYNGYEFEVFRSGEQLNSNFRGKTITAIFNDSSGNLWVGTANGYINFRKNGTEVFENWDSQFPEIKLSQITAFYEDAKKNIWIATRFSGVLSFSPSANNLVTFSKEKGNFPDQVEVFDIAEDSKGKIWLASVGIGVHFLNDKGTFVPSHDPQQNRGVMEGYRKKLFVDGDFIWIATEGTGLFKMNTETYDIIRYSPDNQQFKVSTNNIRGIVKTNDGYLFAPSDGGGLNAINLNTVSYTHLTLPTICSV